jgi:nucleoside-diphosphate-sugar epimerase
MKVLVSGHSGFIGPIVIRMLHERGHSTIGLDVGYFDAIDKPWLNSEKPHHEVISDIRNFSDDVFEGVDGIIHLCAISNDPMGQLNPEITNKINFEAGIKFAKAAKNNGVKRFVFASSCSIYGNAGWVDKPLDESAKFNPVSAYAVSKVNMENGLSELADDDFSPVFMRNATAYGVSSKTRLDLVVANLMASALTSNKIRVLSDGTPWRPLTHIEDIALGAVCGLEADQDAVHNKAFNIGRSDANYRVIDIAGKVSEMLSGVELEIVGDTAGDTRSYQVNFDYALNNLPGFTPAWDLERGVKQLLEWFEKQDLEQDMLTSRYFIRLRQLQHLQSQNLINSDLEYL